MNKPTLKLICHRCGADIDSCALCNKNPCSNDNAWCTACLDALGNRPQQRVGE